MTEVNIMGIVKTITSGTAVVHIDDGCFGGLDRAEIARRRAEVDRVIWRINQASADACGTQSSRKGVDTCCTNTR